jgi:serine carboxypeptidase
MVGPDSYQRCAKRNKKGSYWETSPGDFSFALLIPQLFFWFFPSGPEGSLDDLIFWYVVYRDLCLLGLWLSRVLLRTNGGPGCSSLEGSFQENGVSFLQIITRTISETA